MEETKLTVEKTEKTEKKVDKKQLKKSLDDAKAARDKLATELSKKVYLVEGKAKMGEKLLDFLENEAKWTSQESLGVVRAHADLKSAIKKSKKGELYLQGLCVEAIAYFLNKAEGIGLEEATSFKDMFTSINSALGQAREDQTKLERLDQEWQQASIAHEQGVNIE